MYFYAVQPVIPAKNINHLSLSRTDFVIFPSFNGLMIKLHSDYLFQLQQPM